MNNLGQTMLQKQYANIQTAELIAIQRKLIDIINKLSSENTSLKVENTSLKGEQKKLENTEFTFNFL